MAIGGSASDRRAERLTFGHSSFAPVPAPAAATAAARLAHEAQPVDLRRIETWDWGWGGLLLFSILLFFRPQDQLPFISQLHFSDAAAVVGLGAMVFLNVSRGQALTRMTPELAAVWALGAVILATVPFSIWPGGSVTVFIDVFVKVMLIFMLMVNSMTSPRRIAKISWVIVLAFGFVAARAWFDYFRGVNLYEGNRVGGAPGGMFENPNDLAMNLVTFLPLAMIHVKRKGPVLARLTALVIVILMFGAIVFTKSRGGFVGMVLMLGAYVVITRSLKPATIAGMLVAGMLALPLAPQAFWTRMESITDPSKDATGSRSERLALMQQAWAVFLDYPLTGIGAGQFQNFGPPGQARRWRVTHNAYLQLAAEIGIAGVVLFLFLLVRGLRAALWTRRVLTPKAVRRRPRRGPPPAQPEDGLTPDERTFLSTHASAMCAGLIGWALCAMFASLAYDWTFYYVLGLCVCARDVVRARARAYREAKALGTGTTVAA